MLKKLRQTNPFEGRNRILNLTVLVVVAVLVVIAMTTSSQDMDLRHTAYMGTGLLTRGLEFYTVNDADTIANYLPSTYLLTQIVLLPAKLMHALLGSEQCSILNTVPCLWEGISLKLGTILLAFVWLRLVSKDFLAKRALLLLLLPVVMYAWLLFNAYDGIGAFVTLIGATMFYKEDLFAKFSPQSQKFLPWVGVFLAALGVSMKFLPLPLFVGCAMAYSKNVRKFFVGLAVVAVITVGQIAVAQAYGCLWHAIVRFGSPAASPVEAALKVVALVPLFASCAWLFWVFLRKKGSFQLGALAALASYALLLPFNIPHPQWFLYYGVALFAAFATIPLGKNAWRLMVAVICIQGIGILMYAQDYPQNADISMALRLQGVMLPLLQEYFPTAAYFATFGRKIMRITLIVSFVVFAYEWYKVQKHNAKIDESTVAIPAESALRQLAPFAWAGALALVVWHGTVVAMFVKAKFF